MGITTVEVTILGPRRSDDGTPLAETVQAIVDAGATLSVFPASTLEKLGLSPIAQATVRVGDGRRIYAFPTEFPETTAIFRLI